MRSVRRVRVLGASLFAAAVLAGALTASGGAQTSQSSNKEKSKHADDYLVHGTVFTPNGFAFPGMELRLRRTTEKKFRWNTYTNSRGEFAVRVKQGGKYELVVHAKGFKDQSKIIDATSGNYSEDLTFRMEVKEGKKK
jgi:Carboxypeptidase regulatory-like domain